MQFLVAVHGMTKLSLLSYCTQYLHPCCLLYAHAYSHISTSKHIGPTVQLLFSAPLNSFQFSSFLILFVGFTTEHQSIGYIFSSSMMML